METAQRTAEIDKEIASMVALLALHKTRAARREQENGLMSINPPTSGGEQAILSDPADGNDSRATYSVPRQCTELTDNNLARTQSEQPEPVTDFTHAYYSDLLLWLEVTGYHDIEYRNSQIANIKERKSLEQEAARITERLAKLNQDAQVSASFRHSTPAPKLGCENQNPPPPAMIPSARATPAVAGTKRAHSPVELLPSKKISIKQESEEDPGNPRYDILHQFALRDYGGISALQDTRAMGSLERGIVFK